MSANAPRIADAEPPRRPLSEMPEAEWAQRSVEPLFLRRMADVSSHAFLMVEPKRESFLDARGDTADMGPEEPAAENAPAADTCRQACSRRRAWHPAPRLLCRRTCTRAMTPLGCSTANEIDDKANRLSFRSLTKPIARGATEEPFKTIVWKGAPEHVVFQVEVPAQDAPSSAEAVLYVSVGGVPVGDIEFVVRVAAIEQQAADEAVGRATRYERAFISYSRRDRDKVSLFAQGLKQSNITTPYLDLTALEPGDEWAQQLPVHIANSDVFYLMWSNNAALSRWVGRESWEAVKLYKASDPRRPRIVPITLHRRAPLPPRYLRQFHFHSPWLAQRAAGPLFRPTSS
jgi:hypothetical protein